MPQKCINLALVSIILLLSACSPVAQESAFVSSPTAEPQRWMTVAYIEGSVEVQETANGAWQAVSVGQRLPPDCSLRAAVDSLLQVTINDGSAFIAGPESLLTVDQFSPELENTLTTLNLQQGGVFVVAAGSSLGSSGSFNVKTVALMLSITGPQTGALRGHGLAMPYLPSGYVGSGIVTIVKGKTPSEAATQVGMMSGNGTLTFPGDNTRSLQVEQFMEVNHADGSIQTIPADLVDDAWRLGVYYLPVLIHLLTGTPTVTPTATVTPLPSTATATWTPFPTYEATVVTSTPNPLPTHRAFTPNPNWTPGADGLTQAESANAGSHPYVRSCVPSGDCICSGDAYTVGNITFTNDSVMLEPEAGAGSITYSKVSDNTYALQQGEMSATITFFIDGWDFVVTKNGAACSFQTFLLQ